MADFDWNKLGNSLGDVGQLAGTLVGAYYGVPQAESADRFIKNAAIVGNMQYNPTDMSGLTSQYNNTPTLRNITAKDLYNPSDGELFSTYMGAGLAGYGAASNLTSRLNGVFNKNGGEGTPNYVPGKHDWKEIQDLPVGGGANASDTGEAMAALGGHLHSCGGHKFAEGGVTMDWGKGLSTGLNLLTAFGSMGLAYAGVKRQKDLAKIGAQAANAANQYALQLNQNNFDNALTDTKNNMFNQQALHMAAMGGDLQTLGADFPLNGGYNVIGAGGTHEQNPNGGVFQGMAADGKPNLVEENEVVWNNYVFSNRINVPKDFAKTYKLKDGISYADAAQKLIEEAKERPNDPISQNGIADALGALQTSQEETKQKREAARMKRVINKMSPEELMQLVGAAQSAQAPESAQMPEGMGAMPQGMELPQEMPAEGPQMGVGPEEMPFAYGGHMFKRGGTAKPSSEADVNARYADQMRRLYETFGGEQGLKELRAIAAQYPGYDPNTIVGRDDIVNFLSGVFTGSTGYQTFQDKYRDLQKVPYLVGDDAINNAYQYEWLNQKERQKWRQGIDRIWKNYRGSKAKGSEGYYGIANDGNAQNEQIDDYQDFVEYVSDNLEDALANYGKGLPEDQNKDWIVDIMKMNDANINKDSGAPTILKYDADGNVIGINDAQNAKGLSGIDLFRSSANDGKSGTRHLYTTLFRNAYGRHLYVDEDGNVIDPRLEDGTINPMYSEVRSYDKKHSKDLNDYTDTYHVMRKNAHEANLKKPTEEVQPQQGLPTWMRYAPAVGSALGALASLKPAKDYSTAVSPIYADYAPIGDYLPYKPVDTQRYINAENQRAAAQLNAIMNATSGNRNAALAQAAFANQQRQQNIGQLLQGAEQVNWDRLRQTGEFNRGTNQFNAQAHNQAELANMHNAPTLLNQAQNNERMRYHADNDRDTAISSNLTTMFNNLGDIGNENVAWNQANSNQALRFLSNSNPFIGQGESSFKRALGGKMLTKKNRR